MLLQVKPLHSKKHFNLNLKNIVTIISNAKTLASTMKELGYKLITDGTDTHLILIDLSNKNKQVDLLNLD